MRVTVTLCKYAKGAGSFHINKDHNCQWTENNDMFVLKMKILEDVEYSVLKHLQIIPFSILYDVIWAIEILFHFKLLRHIFVV